MKEVPDEKYNSIDYDRAIHDIWFRMIIQKPNSTDYLRAINDIWITMNSKKPE